MALPGAKALAELSCIVIFQLIPWDQLSQLDPAIVTRELSSKRQEDVLERELITMLTSVHVENSGQLLGANEPNLVHLNRKKLLASIAPQWIWLLSGGPVSGLLGSCRGGAVVDLQKKTGSR